MTQTLQSNNASRRNKLIMQLLAFIALAVLLYYRPAIEAWVNAKQAAPAEPATNSDSSATVNLPRPRPQIQPAGVPDDNDARLPDSSLLPAGIPGDDASEEFEGSAGGAATLPTFGSDRGKQRGKVENRLPDQAQEDPSASNADTDGSDSADSTTTSKSESPEDSKSDKGGSSDQPPESSPAPSSGTTQGKSSRKSGRNDSVSRMERDPPPKRTAGGSANEAAPKKDGSTGQNPEWGKLKEIRNNVFESTAGLVYRSGSADGHRLKHVMQHAKDNTSKPVHGVFVGEGDREIVLAMIDEAFDKTKKNGNKDVRKEGQGERVVFTVNMKRPVGFMGGQEGERRGNPECRFIRIVLERDNEVISAFPTNR